ncbi:1-phosphofructokinase family hexose kinase [Pseudonocardia sp. HH130630-07]|uniref:1-phosphofructokinase family hexose kinase n=1 Tax=Pseudonocardia sp. HH130630-07 TaxID=1690815 RepID=UPI000814D026|nr:hexose kinase [Pseudonocardia sp. HH130630-07]ANY07993.1 hypothetical protein AFB00_18715 [Pseudonocardia sp. HH130630-07]
MILTVCANPALDVTYRVPALTTGSEHRVPAPVVRAGGKAVNVAAALHTMGRDPVVVAPYGGPEGAVLAADLTARGLEHRLVPVPGAVRRTVTIVDDAGAATALNERGTPLPAAGWARVTAVVRTALPAAAALVLSGSLPPGLPDDAWAPLVAAGRAAGVPVVLDAAGPALLAGIAAGPDLVKPNARELREATGDDDVVSAARQLVARGAAGVLASLGPDGMVLVDGPTGEPLTCRPPAGSTVRNPTGAGDAAVAAAACALAEGAGRAVLLYRAVAWSVAAVAEPRAGELDPHTVRRTESALGRPPAPEPTGTDS